MKALTLMTQETNLGFKMKRSKSVIGDKTEKLGKNDMDSSEGIEYKPLCQEDIARITSSKGLLSRNFHAYDLIAQQKTNLQVRAYMDYYGGYSEHGRNVVYGLHGTGKYNVRVQNIKTPVDVDPITWQKNNWYIHNDIDVRDSKYLVIAGPGWLQEKFLPESRQILGWTMIESMMFSKECAEWLQNADYMLCPTDTDIRRAESAGCKNVQKMRLGFDETTYNPDVEPVRLTGIDDSRYVFGVLGSWNIRKGVKEIIKAYCEAFDSKSNTTLLMCSKYGNRSWGKDKNNKERWTIQYEFNQILEEIKATGNTDLPHISLIDIPVHETVLPHLMARFDCLVGFSSGESTWLPGIQAMGMKIPVIQLANDCCGYMEYLNDDNSYLCKSIKYGQCTEEFWRTTSEYYEDQVFGNGDYKELTALMSDVYNINTDVSSFGRMINSAYKEAQKWTWSKSITALDKFLQTI